MVQPQSRSKVPRHVVVRSIARGVLGMALASATLFLTAGRFDWGMAWLYVAYTIFAICGLMIYLIRRDPDLLAERLKGFKGTKPWDRLLAPMVAVVLPLALLLVAGLDQRFGWSPPLALSLKLTAFAVMVCGWALVVWAMTSNTFFAAAVRIQTERGQTVITTGPYAYIRHPGYTGASAAYLAVALMLGSLWALVPAALVVVLFVLRTALEDRTLMEELDGYQDYSKRVRFRLVPGIW